LQHYARWLPATDDHYLAVLDAFALGAATEGREKDGEEQASGDA